MDIMVVEMVENMVVDQGGDDGGGDDLDDAMHLPPDLGGRQEVLGAGRVLAGGPGNGQVHTRKRRRLRRL